MSHVYDKKNQIRAAIVRHRLAHGSERRSKQMPHNDDRVKRLLQQGVVGDATPRGMAMQQQAQQQAMVNAQLMQTLMALVGQHGKDGKLVISSEFMESVDLKSKSLYFDQEFTLDVTCGECGHMTVVDGDNLPADWECPNCDAVISGIDEEETTKWEMVVHHDFIVEARKAQGRGRIVTP